MIRITKFFRKRLGDILIHAGAINEEQLKAALEEQQLTPKKRLGQILIEKGFITEEHMLKAFEAQLNVFSVNLNNYDIDPDAATSIPMDMAQRYKVIPIKKEGSKLIIAMADPLNVVAMDDISVITGMDVEPVVAGEGAISRAIDQYFGLKQSLDVVLKPRRQEQEEDLQRLQAKVEDAPIVKVVNSMIHQAIAERASDIHIEPSAKGLRVRLRIDGVLQNLFSPPKNTQPLIITRLKILSNMDISERRLPQDGHIQMVVNNKDVNLRVSTLPTVYGEKVVIRIMDRDRIIVPINKLGFSDYNQSLYNQFISKSVGMILVTGPTGCGKSTTLYSTINHLNLPDENIITVEDPVEYQIDGVNQLQVNPRIKLTFASALRTILRQDPDIIMIGEIRDKETAEMATRAALTGHLVFSTLHTNDAPRTISRLLDMNIEKFLITSSLVGVVSQRLVRVICSHCKESYRPGKEETVLYRQLREQDPPQVLYRGAGCSHCNNTGYSGRTAIHEVLAVTPSMRELILQDGTPDDIQKLALSEGMVPMLMDGLIRVDRGDTTLEELVRVAYGI